MAIPANQIWENQTGGSDTACSGGFNPAAAGMVSDLSATVATGTAPVVSSASYNFAAGDVGAWLFIRPAGVWYGGWYKIASVASNKATLNAAIGAAVTVVGSRPSFPNSVAGCATTASPTAGQWATDYSQSVAAAFSYTTLTTSGANATLLTATASKAMIGNTVQITAGTNFLAGFYAITTATAGVSLTLDRTCASGAGALGVGCIGGALATPSQVAAVWVASNTLCMKAGTYSVTATPIQVLGSIVIMGYSAIRGDAVYPPPVTIQANGVASEIVQSGATIVLTISNIDFDANNQASMSCISLSSAAHRFFNCRFRRFSIWGISGQGTTAATMTRCEVGPANGGDAFPNATPAAWIFEDCNIHDCVNGANFNGASSSIVMRGTVVANNTANAPAVSAATMQIFGGMIYGNAKSGVGGTTTTLNDLVNTIIYGNGDVGVNATTMPVWPRATKNFSGGNTNGDYPANYSPLANTSLSADPTVGGASGNFALNTVAGGGSACRSAGYPGAFPGGNTTGYLDGGPIQHANPTLASAG